MNQVFPPAEYLARIRPFLLLDQEDINYIVSRMNVSLYKAGKTVFKKGKVLDRIYLVRSGEIGLFHDDDLLEVVGEGEFFGWSSALKSERTEFEGRALRDTICFEFRVDDIKKLMGHNSDFKSFLENLTAKRFAELIHAEENGIFRLFSLKISDVIHRNPVKCDEKTALIDVVRLMNEQGVGSVLVVNKYDNPVGIITHSDITRIIAENPDNVKRTAKEVMTSPVIAVDLNSSLFDAYRKFVEYGINHLVVAENGKAKGVITIKNLLKHFEPQMNLLNLPRLIKKIKKVEDLEKIEREVETSLRRFLKLGFSYEKILSVLIPVTDSIIEKYMSLSLNSERVSLAVIGDFGRREFDYPVRYQILDIDGNAEPEYEFNLVKIQRFEGIEELNSDEIFSLIDSRYIFGEGERYISFRMSVEMELEKLRDEARDLLLKTLEKKFTLENLFSHLESIARYLAVIEGDYSSKSTSDRLKRLKLLNSNIAQATAEAYNIAKYITLKQKLFGKIDRFEEFLIKESVMHVRNFSNELQRVVENGK